MDARMDAWIIEGAREAGTEGVREGRKERKREEGTANHPHQHQGWLVDKMSLY